MGKKAVSFKCHKLSGGLGRGKALISAQDICFYQAEPDTGEIFEKGHDLQGQSVARKVVIFRGGKGSSVVQGQGLHQLQKMGTAPAAMVIQDPDNVLVAGAVIWKIPLVDRVNKRFYEYVKNGCEVEVDADKGLITLMVESSRESKSSTARK